MQPEKQEGDEIEEGRPGNRIFGREHAGGDDGGDGVGGVVQPVEKIKQQRDANQDDEQGNKPYTCSITMPLMRLATSSKRSTTFSR